MKVLVVKPTALGDVAQALAVAPLLKQWPDCGELVWLVDEEYAPLVRLSPAVDRLILFPRKRWSRQCNGREIISWLLALRRENFGLVLDLQGLARSGFMTGITGAPRRVGLASARELSGLACNETVADGQEHAVDRYLAAVRQVVGAETPGAGARAVLDIPPTPLPEGLQSGCYTVLHPYSQWQTKLWPWENYETMARACPEETFVLIGYGAFFPVQAPNCVDLRNRTTLELLLAVLAHARVVISTDSGPLHVAAALGRPVLGLYGATDPGRTGPRGTRATVLTTDLPCRPCLSRTCTNAQPLECLQKIGIDRVLQGWANLSCK